MKDGIFDFIRDPEGPRGIAIDSWLEKDRLALILIDMQNYITDRRYTGKWSSGSGGKYYYNRLENIVIPNTLNILDRFRELGLTVIFTRIATMNKNFLDLPGGLARKVLSEELFDGENNQYHLYYEDNDSQIDSRLSLKDNEIVIIKTSSGAFCSSDIDLILRSNNISRLVFLGGLTDGCVSSTLREAVDRGYLCTLIEDACITTSRQDHEAALRSLGKFYAWVTSTDALLENLK